MQNILVAVLFFCTSVSLSGCGTFLRGEKQGVYRGTKMDAVLLFLGASPASIVGEGHLDPVSDVAIRTCFVVGGLVDLPVSLVTDTVFLPYDLREDSKRLAEWEASLRPLKHILDDCIPAGAEILECPKQVATPCFLHPNPVVMLVGVGIDWTIEGRRGMDKVIRYSGKPDSRITIFEIEDQDREMHYLVIREYIHGKQDLYKKAPKNIGTNTPNSHR